MPAVTRLCHICNQDIREGVASITDKLRKAHLRWYGNVFRADEESVCKMGFAVRIPEGRTKLRWMDSLHADLNVVDIHPDQSYDG
ncbi:hypothetical protein ANCDUO_17562 [Ancylostoma duodenale]|uniref:Uncharacterized protein n=1 Tax=Ancylostoma duodenale TaxID=51022 RepID=A0A0C2CR99_9BILA|nr:hypothetical protein ANCDUO_17562 [Ancylostoma duodenale]